MIKLLPLYKPISSVNELSELVLNKGQKMTFQAFADEFGVVKRSYLSKKQRDSFCAEADIFADKLFENNKNDFAGIIMSSLCKLTEFFPDKLEQFAQKGYKIAKANGDCVHMMARLNDLRKIYYRRPDKVNQYVQVLYKQEMCLKELSKNYDNAIASFKTINRKVALKKDYEQMLGHVQVEIGKLTKRKHPEQARSRLISAREIFDKRGNTKNVNYIDMLISEIDADMSYNGFYSNRNII